MKRLAIPLVALLFACGETPTEPTTDPGAPEPSFEATTNTQSVTVPLNGDIYVPCANGGAGEVVRLTGTLHIVTGFTTDAEGGLHITTFTQYQGVVGVGLTSGDSYRGTGVNQLKLNATDGANAFASVHDFRVIGRGTSLLVHTIGHLTVNANGEPTAVFEIESVECM